MSGEAGAAGGAGMSGEAGAAGGIRVLALPTTRRFRPGDELAPAIVEAAQDAGAALADGDVVCVASKVVGLVEGALAQVGGPDLDPAEAREARRRLARAQAAAIVADTPGVLVTRTAHGFVAANGGIDASNVPDGWALLLPADPDASAVRLRDELARLAGVDVAVIVTDTFGRPWRVGQTDVALGVAGMAALRDERGGVDLDGRVLDVTQPAIADEAAAAADLVRRKDSGTPFVLLRGVDLGPSGGRDGSGRDLVRPSADDLFAVGGPTAAEHAVAARRTVRTFDADRPVPGEALRAAVAAAATAPAPHHTRPWRFVRLQAGTRTRLLDAMARRWYDDLVADGVATDAIEQRLARSDAVLRAAPELLAAFVVLDGAHAYPDARRSTAERDLFLLSGGAALGNAQVVLAAHGLGAAWISSTAFCGPTVREHLGLDDSWEPVGMLAIGWPAASPPPRAPVDVEALLVER